MEFYDILSSMKINKLVVLFIMLVLICCNTYTNTVSNIKLLPGSNIYIRIFLFFFPITKKYEVYFDLEENTINLKMMCKKTDIINEPATPSYFDSNITFHIKNIPIHDSSQTRLPISIQCNQKFIKKKIDFTIYKKEDILILKGALNNLKIKEITNKQYFKNRFNWKYPLYFDLRLQLIN